MSGPLLVLMETPATAAGAKLSRTEGFQPSVLGPAGLKVSETPLMQ